MLRKFGSHLRDQWIGTTALFLVLAGGTAYAANTISSTDIVNNQVFGADVRDDSLAGGGLGHVDLKPGAVRSSEVAVDSLTGTDIGPKAVGASEVALGSLATDHIENESLYGSDIADRSLGGEDLGGGEITKFELDEYEMEGLPVGGREVETSAQVNAPQNQYVSATADCPSDQFGRKKQVIGGGYFSNYPVRVLQSYPLDEDTWRVTVYNDLGGEGTYVEAWAVCAFSD